MEIAKFSKSGGDEILAIAPEIDRDKGKDLLRKANALIRFHYKMDPDQLTDAEFSEMWQQLRYALEFEDRRVSIDDKQKTIFL